MKARLRDPFGFGCSILAPKMRLIALLLTLTAPLATFAADNAPTNPPSAPLGKTSEFARDSLPQEGVPKGKVEGTLKNRTSVHVIYRSRDQGISWSRSDSGLPGSARINALEAHGQSIFAGTDAGIFVSSDSGQTWTAAPALPASARRVLCFASWRETLLAGTERSGILGSPDGGRTWKSLNQGLGNQNVRSLLNSQDVIYAGTDKNGVFRSKDGGQTWALSNQGIPARAQIFAMSAVGNKVFAGLYSKGLYRWDERDQTWSRMGRVSPLVLATAGGTLAVGHNPGGIFWSADVGETWNDGSAGLPAEAPIWAMTSDGNRLFAGASGGIYYSENRSRTWIRALHGLPSVSPGVAFLATDDFVLAASIIKE